MNESTRREGVSKAAPRIVREPTENFEFQQIASVDTETGEVQEKRLAHREEAEAFYRALAGQKVRVGMEASGHGRWFERLVAELQFELLIGDAARHSHPARAQTED